MKKIIISLLLSVFPLTAAIADENSRQVLERMEARMTEYGNYRIDFTASTTGMGSVSGMYIVSGDKYYIKVQRQEQFSDGATRWEINPSDKEVVIDHVDLDSRNILSNPTKAFDFAPGEFESSYLGIVLMNEMPCHGIVLEPLSKLQGIGTVNLYVSVAADLPVSVSYDFEGERLTVKIDKFTGMVTADQKQFEFDSEKYKGYEVIDFR